jgi:hypothetical protein
MKNSMQNLMDIYIIHKITELLGCKHTYLMEIGKMYRCPETVNTKLPYNMKDIYIVLKTMGQLGWLQMQLEDVGIE